MKKGFSLLEIMISLIVISIIILSIFKYYKIFDDLRVAANAENNMKEFVQHIDYLSKDINFIKGSMISETNTYNYNINNNYDENFNIDDRFANNVFRIEKLYDYKSKLNITGEIGFADDTINSSEQMMQIMEYFQIEDKDNAMFLNKLYVYVANEKFNYKGNISVNIKNFTFIYISDSIVNNYIKRSQANRDSFFEEILEEVPNLSENKLPNFLYLKNSTNQTTRFNNHINNNLPEIKRSILIKKYSLKKEVINILNDMDYQLTEAQKRFNAWVRIKSRFSAYQSLNITGNNMDIDYFISCLYTEGNNYKCQDTTINSMKTLLPLDQGLDGSINGSVNFKNAFDENSEDYSKIPSEYGFILYPLASCEDDNMDLSSCIGNTEIVSSTLETETEYELNEQIISDSMLEVKIFNAAILDNQYNLTLTDNNENKIDYTNRFTEIYTVPNSLRSFVPKKLNPFGYNVYFINNIGSIEKSNEVFVNGVSSLENNDISLKVSIPIIKTIVDDVLMAEGSPPYNAKIFTLLPDGTPMIKNLYNNSF